MTITYHEDGPWGTGVHRDILPEEVDGSFFFLDQKIDTVSLRAPVDIANFSTSGASFFVQLSDGTQRGPFQLPLTFWTFRGPWAASIAYAPSDVVTNQGAAYLVLLPHTSAATFDPAANDGMGHDYYGLLTPAPVGVPAGGTTGQALVKLSNTDYNSGWGSTGVPLGGTSGQVLAKHSGADLDTIWETLPPSIPNGGLQYQALTKNSNTSQDIGWNNLPFFRATTQSSTYTLQLADAWSTINCYAATITIPPFASVPFVPGTIIVLTINESSTTGPTSVLAGAGVFIEPAFSSYSCDKDGGVIFLINSLTDFWQIAGDLDPIITTLTATGTVAVDFTDTDIVAQTPAANITYNNVASTVQKKRITFVFTTSGVTSFNITFGTNFMSQGVLATGTVSGKRFVVEFVGDGTNYIEVSRTGAM